MESKIENFTQAIRTRNLLPNEHTIEKCVELFSRQFTQGPLQWDKVKPLGPSQAVPYDQLAPADPSLLNKIAILKLNGGLGTSMGLSGPKSIITVKQGFSFLDITFKQLQVIKRQTGVDVPLVFMNSFNTDTETREVAARYPDVTTIHFLQNQFPRIDKETMLPVPMSPNTTNEEEWYPPGHGDVLDSLFTTGTLAQLRSMGKEYVFISNVDNLGATLDLQILTHMAQRGDEIVMELTPKTMADIKGGTVAEYDGKLRLVEVAQVPKQFLGEFTSLRKFSFFNTNSIWFNLEFMERALTQKRFQLDVIVNPKAIGRRPVIQLETAVGSSISCAERGSVVCVPRSRFLPVKTCNDLLMIQSDLYVLDSDARLVLNPARNAPNVPVISLGPAFKKVGDYLGRFGGFPRLLDLDSLTVTGDVNFGPNVTLSGHVSIVAPPGSHIDIAPGSVLENCVVTGALSIIPRV